VSAVSTNLAQCELAVLAAVDLHTRLVPRFNAPAPLLNVLRDLRCGCIQREAFCLKVNDGFPEAGAINDKTDTTWPACSRLEPMKNVFLTCPTPACRKSSLACAMK